MSLKEWQKLLQDHFTELRRKKKSQETPIFALEHGLSPDSELIDLQKEIRTYIARFTPNKEHWLPWIVYASEIGYLYSGEEYWQTFENLTPGWDGRDRDWIRNCFKMFHSKLGGAEPKGAWAQHFSIICWPITHAILPKDLQYQLAKVLYRMSLTLRKEILDSPDLLGKRIEALNWDTTSRFKVFTQEHLLVGHIATALLSDEKQLQETLILPQTLTRIVSDLERECQARYWLKDAKRAIQQVKFYGTQKSNITKTGGFIHDLDEDSQEQFATLAIEPYVILRPATTTSWEVVVEIPNLSPLLTNFPHFKGVLSDLRCVVVGSSGRPLARGRLLLDSQRVVIQEWPKWSEALLQFEQQVPTELEHILKTYCLLRPGPDWLFRIQSDGLAYEVWSKVVRPGQSYILLSTEELQSTSIGREIYISCKGVHAIRLDLPTSISSDLEEEIESLNLNIAKSLQVWPAGLPPANWDGQGRGEWLSSDCPTIGIRVDHKVGGIALNLDDSENPEIYSLDPNENLFVELPNLPPGYHCLKVSLLSKETKSEEQCGEIDILIREPRAWVPGLTYQNPLIVLVDPVVPTLEQLWEGKVAIEVQGPKGRNITCSASFWRKDTKSPLINKKYPIKLPVEADSWRLQFNEHFRKEVQDKYDLAQICQIDFDAEELGKYTLHCEREFTPIRWIARFNKQKYSLILVDNTGINTPVQIYRYGFDTPDICSCLRVDIANLNQIDIDTGGLYVAKSGQYQCSIILPSLVKNMKLSDWHINPKFQYRTCSQSTIVELVDLFESWAKARLSGDIISLSRQLEVLASIVQEIFAIICGERCREAEKESDNISSQFALNPLKQYIARKDGDIFTKNFSTEEINSLCNVSAHNRVLWLSSLAKKLGLPTNLPKSNSKDYKLKNYASKKVIRRGPQGLSTWLVEFALRLASYPSTLRPWSGSNFIPGINNLINVPALARISRFFVLSVHKHFPPSRLVGGRSYNGWEWE